MEINNEIRDVGLLLHVDLFACIRSSQSISRNSNCCTKQKVKHG